MFVSRAKRPGIGPVLATAMLMSIPNAGCSDAKKSKPAASAAKSSRTTAPASDTRGSSAASTKPPPVASVEQRLPRIPSDLRWLAVGGGSDPLSNQISLAQDLQLATSLLSGRGLTLFASGPGAQVSVSMNAAEEERAAPTPRETAKTSAPKRAAAKPSSLGRGTARADLVRASTELAALLGPPGALHVRYQPTSLAIDAPATRDHVLDALRGALEAGSAQSAPLLVLAASHGERGAVPRENALALWGGWSLDVQDVAAVLDGFVDARPTRWVITSCYGGGFAELAFVGANPQQGSRSAQHCGLFAAPADDESSGCDPNPDRQQQESFTIHFLAALRGRDKSGSERLGELDLDKDHRVSLREAHAWARIHSRSFDVPTTTSERYLREVTRPFEGAHEGAEPDVEERSVVTALAGELELEDERRAREKLQELDRILADAAGLLDDAQQTADDSYYALRVALLERWPLLEHSWDPRATELVTQQAASILALLTESELAHGNQLAARELDEASAQHDAVRVARARVLRLVRAFETLRLASALKRQGGPKYLHWQELVACERYVP
jgi:hypothetical protein